MVERRLPAGKPEVEDYTNFTYNARLAAGACGCRREYPFVRKMRDAMITRIAEVTNQVQRVIVAGQILIEDLCLRDQDMIRLYMQMAGAPRI